MFDLQSAAEAEGRQSEAKVWGVLISQIWSGLSGYCCVTSDLPEVNQLMSILCRVSLLKLNLLGIDAFFLSASLSAALQSA